jgi:hypothetical protein
MEHKRHLLSKFTTVVRATVNSFGMPMFNCLFLPKSLLAEHKLLSAQTFGKRAG